MRVVTIHNRALEQLGFWAENDLKILKRIVQLLRDIEKLLLRELENLNHLNTNWKATGAAE